MLFGKIGKELRKKLEEILASEGVLIDFVLFSLFFFIFFIFFWRHIDRHPGPVLVDVRA